MKKLATRWNIIGLAAIIALAGTGVYNFAGSAEAQEGKAAAPAAAPANKKITEIVKEDVVYATFDGGQITGKDVLTIVKQLPPQLQAAPGEKVLELIVNQLINDRLVDKAATDAKVADEEIVKQRIADNTKQVIRERFIEKKIESKINDAAIKAKYDELVKQMPAQDEIRASHILVTDEKTANEVLAKLAKGEDFAALAKQYSIDPTKDNGGDLGYFTKAAMVKEFGDAAFAMNKGDVSKTAVKTQFGYHIIKVVDKRKQAPPPLEAVKDRIKGQLTEEQVRKVVEEERTKANIKLQNMPAAAAPAPAAAPAAPAPADKK